MIERNAVVKLILALAFPVLVGIGFTAAKHLLGVIPASLLAALRYSIGGLALLCIFGIPNWRTVVKLAPIATMSIVVQFILTYSGIKLLPISSASLLIQLEVPFIIILSALFLNDTISIQRIIGVTVAFIGATIMLMSPDPRFNLLGCALLIVGALAWALGQIAVLKLKVSGGFKIAGWLAVIAAPQLWIASAIIDGNPVPHLANLATRDWLVIFYIGTGPTVVAYGVWYWLLERTTINQIAPVLSLIPIVATLCGMIFLGEIPETNTVVGGAIILVGAALATNLKRPEKLKV